MSIVHTSLVLKFVDSRREKIKILLAPMKALTISKDCSGNGVIISIQYRLPSMSLVDFVLWPPLIGCRKNPRKCACLMRLQI
jgi:hypothetical protein